MQQMVLNDAKQILYQQKNSLSFMVSTLISKPRIITSNQQNDLLNIRYNLASYQKAYLKNQRGYIQHYASIIKLMSPETILKKGFALVKVDGKIISNPSQLNTGSNFDVILGKQQIHSTVQSKTPYNENDINL
jgi:exodeoxyribonuclease VII large subunit